LQRNLGVLYLILRMVFFCFIKMWRMALFICHNCGERKNIVGHCWSSVSPLPNPNTDTCCQITNFRSYQNLGTTKVDLFLIFYQNKRKKYAWRHKNDIIGVVKLFRWKGSRTLWITIADICDHCVKMCGKEVRNSKLSVTSFRG
jgi:hypothetical protein